MLFAFLCSLEAGYDGQKHPGTDRLR
jgi:hypothetical protein